MHFSSSLLFSAVEKYFSKLQSLIHLSCFKAESIAKFLGGFVAVKMEEKGGVSPSGVITVKGDEEATEFQQNPSLLQSVGPTTVVSPSPPPPPPPPPTSVTPVSAAAAPPPLISSAGLDLTKKKRGRPRKYAPDGSLNPRYLRPTLSPTPISTSIPFSGDYSHWKQGKAQQYLPVELIKKPHMFEYGSSPGNSCSLFLCVLHRFE